MKVNFNIKVRPSLFSEEVDHDFTKEIANVIWQSARTVTEADFALRLFNSVGDMEITKEEADIIKGATANFLWFAQSEILKVIENNQ